MKTILATAYAVNPYKGSEDGMGWNFIMQIARFNKVIAITRENNRHHIEQYIKENPDERYQRMTFFYFDLPYWMRFWKKGGRGAMLYFWMWQRAIPGFAKRLKLAFEIAHNVNFHNDWTPSYLWKLNKPFVWGPIGHHPRIPNHFLRSASRWYRIKDIVTLLVKKFFWNISPGLKKTVAHADHILCMNSDVSKVIPLRQRKHSIMPSVATEDHGCTFSKPANRFTLISAGRLVPLKGFDLAIEAFETFIKNLPHDDRQKCEMIIVGSGPERTFYKELVKNKSMDRYVRFVEWIERPALMKLYQESSAFIFPSHEGAGMVVAEALSFGLPVICLDNAGPGEFIDDQCGIRIRANSFEQATNGLCAAIEALYRHPSQLMDMSRSARRRFEEHFRWDSRGEKLRVIYENLAP